MAKVLIIEDDPLISRMYQKVFTFENFEVEMAGDGQEGLEKMASFMPEVVLLDLMMPRMSGFDVLKSVKDKPEFKNVPIIVLTNINPDVPDLLKNWGATNFILKADNTPGQIVERVKTFLKK